MARRGREQHEERRASGGCATGCAAADAGKCGLHPDLQVLPWTGAAQGVRVGQGRLHPTSEALGPRWGSSTAPECSGLRSDRQRSTPEGAGGEVWRLILTIEAPQRRAASIES